MLKEYLPIGSVILLKNAEKRLMICGIMQVNKEDNKEYDYTGCLYPEGILDSQSGFMFDAENIVKVDFIGFVDIERQVFAEKLIQHIESKENKE